MKAVYQDNKKHNEKIVEDYGFDMAGRHTGESSAIIKSKGFYLSVTEIMLCIVLMFFIIYKFKPDIVQKIAGLFV